MATGNALTKVAKKREAQDRVLALLAQGHSVAESMRTVGRKRDRFYIWQQTEPWFKERSNSIRGRERGEAELDFVKFRRAYFGFDTFYHQQKIIEAIEAAEPRSVTMILLPPGSGKTTVIEDYICYVLGPVDPNHRICVISEKRDHATKILRRVANRMVDSTLNAAYINAFGPFKPPDRETQRPWSAHALSIVTASNDERDYSLETQGAGSGIYGARYDLIVLDDVQSIKTLNNTENLLEYFRQDVYTRMPPDTTKGRIIVVGTRVGPDDFYEQLLKLDMVDELVKIPALIEHPDTGDLASYWPKRTVQGGRSVGFDLSDFEKIERFVGPETWSRVYMQEPVSKRGRTFTDHAIARGCREDLAMGEAQWGMYKVGATDPALGGVNVCRVGAFDYESLRLIDGTNDKGLMRYEDIYDRIDMLAGRHHPSVWIIEGNAIQKGLLRDDRLHALAEKHGFRIEAHQTGKNKQDDVIGVATMATPLARGQIAWPWGDQDSRKCFQPLVEDLKRWRPDVPSRMLQQDEVMALWFLYLFWRRTRDSLAVRLSEHITKTALPWRPARYPVPAGMRR